MAPPRSSAKRRAVQQQQEQDDVQDAANDGGGYFSELAKKHWLNKNNMNTSRTKVKQDVIKKDIWDILEKDSFSTSSLLSLESLQLLENHLWPGYTEDASNYHVLLILLLANVKSREHLPIWGIFDNDTSKFSDLFRRALALSLDSTLSNTIRTHILEFVICAFQSLDSGIVRKECAPLVSIAIWHNISSDAKRDKKLEENTQLRRAWRASLKRYNTADDATKARLRFERAWLYSSILDFFNRLYNPNSGDDSLYCERFIEFLSDLQSQLPTRRYFNSLLRDLNTLAVIQLSPMYHDEHNSLIRDLFALLKHYTYFSIDDHTGIQYSSTDTYDQHCTELALLQRVALKHFKSKLTILALSNYASIDKRSELENHLKLLTDAELVSLCEHLELRTSYPNSCQVLVDRQFFLELLLSLHERRKTFQETARELNVLPTERSLLDSSLSRTEEYNGTRPLAIPKLNLQYLTVGDFLWRSFILHRCESFYAIKKDAEETIKRLRPKADGPDETRFEGFFRMALPISKPAIIEMVPPLVGDDKPSAVRAEIVLDVSRLADNIRREWEALRPDDVVFLMALRDSSTTGDSTSKSSTNFNLRYLRAAEVTQVCDENGHSLRDTTGANGYGRPRLRRLQVKLDAEAYKSDLEATSNGKSDIYEHINVIMRRRGRENNFKSVLESIKSLTLSDVPLATWLREVFLGYGDPSAATYPKMSKKISRIDYRDTFLDWQHLVESLPGQSLEPGDEAEGSFGPPYVLSITEAATPEPIAKPTKKHRHAAEPVIETNNLTLKVTSYKPANHGPYPVDIPHLNRIRFTPTQIKAIISGTQPGLTIVVGPPGTGKTDVATQIINNIYHNFPEQRTLLIAHSNQALNQLFQKIVALDIDERHLLRLGHGEEDLDTEANFSKHGRVESFLENRDGFLREVDRLAANFGAPGAHGQSAETADYFKSVYVDPAWTRYQEILVSSTSTADDIIQSFPFHQYFSNTPQPIFSQGMTREEALDVANGCYYHISKIFTELADIRPFEILRRDRDKANYLLTNEARIVAMTSTHAAMRRREIASLGFRYDNVIMEEAAQITEIENFIPLAMQNPRDGEMPLQRVVLCGDHYQNSPVIQNLAFRQYANLEQSLFSRLIRLGVPHINLDQQGRARPTIADLYAWRYENLGSLPLVSSGAEYLSANAGFKFAHQFIQVDDYKGKGELEPTPHFLQNLGEAEYVVAVFQYMRLLGYPANKISILATYAGQKALIGDVLESRCARNPIFGMPKIVATVDKYQGEQNDYVLLSLTRTTRAGYLRDIRRLTVAFSRARLGLYVFGRRAVFEACYELKQAFDILLARPDKLALVTGELWPTTRPAAEDASAVNTAVQGEAVMENVEHMGQYVYEMTMTRTNELRL